MYKVKRYVQVSTDEVYGSILDGAYKEDARLNPTNPYSATKAGADMLTVSYHSTYGLDTIITRTENNYGPWQHPQKAMPTFVRKAMNDELLPVYGDGQHKRMWLHVTDHCRAILLLISKGVSGQIYHVAGEVELANVDLAKRILRLLGKSDSLIKFIDDFDIRPGHDRRYALDSAKIRALGWAPKYDLDTGIANTVRWYQDNKSWSV
jgi:dTDP-glucose 4,6-dehydratase